MNTADTKAAGRWETFDYVATTYRVLRTSRFELVARAWCWWYRFSGECRTVDYARAGEGF